MKSENDVGPRVATHRMEILGWPSGDICPQCVKNAQAVWEEFSGATIDVGDVGHSLGQTFLRKAA